MADFQYTDSNGNPQTITGIPDNFHWAAIDADGSIYAYEDEPDPNRLDQRWVNGRYCTGTWKYLGTTGGPVPNWQEQLTIIDADMREGGGWDLPPLDAKPAKPDLNSKP